VINTDNAYRKKMHHDSGGDSHCVVSKKTKKTQLSLGKTRYSLYSFCCSILIFKVVQGK